MLVNTPPPPMCRPAHYPRWDPVPTQQCFPLPSPCPRSPPFAVPVNAINLGASYKQNHTAFVLCDRFIPLAWCPQVHPRCSVGQNFLPFPESEYTPGCVCTSFCLSAHTQVDTWAVPTFRLPWIVLHERQCTNIRSSPRLRFFVGVRPGVGLLDRMII